MEDKKYGYTDLVCTDATFEDLYQNEEEYAKRMSEMPYSLKENNYLILRNLDNEVKEIRCFQNGSLRRLDYATVDNTVLGEISPLNLQQKLAFDLLQDRTSKVKLLKGVYGSGKDFLMLNHALSLVQRHQFDRIIYVRPNVTVANVPDIGALPGTADEKLAWTLGPVYDMVGGQSGVDMLLTHGKLEAIPLLFIRGRSFENSIVYVTEGQNMTTEITKLILGRIGKDSELWINADNHQTDKKIFDKDNGVTAMIDKLSGNPLFGYVYLPTTERSEVANLANLLD